MLTGIRLCLAARVTSSVYTRVFEPRGNRRWCFSTAAGVFRRRWDVRRSSVELCSSFSVLHSSLSESTTGGGELEVRKLLQPLTYILQAPEELTIFDKFGHAMNYWLKIPIEKFQAIDDISQMLRNSTILTDDIQDNSTLRRGIPVAHAIYGVPHTMTAAQYAICIVLERIIALNHPKAPQIYSEHLSELHHGQGFDIYWRDNYVCPTEPEYRFMAIQKMGGLFKMVVQLMQLFSECKEEFSNLMDILGLYLQVRDDYCNLCMQEYSENKGYCEDLSEGKFGFPIIHAIRSHPEDNQVMTILRQRTKDVNVKKYCITLLDKFGSLAYTRSVLKKLDQSLRDEIERLGGNPLLTAILDEMLNWIENENGETISSENSNVHV